MSVNPNSAVIYFNYYAFHHKNNLLFPYIKLQLFSAGNRCCLAVMPLSDLTKIHTQQLLSELMYVQAYNMLTDDCKEALKYNDAKTFKEYYIDLRFPEKQEYSLSKWAVEGDNVVYLVTFNGDLLATGGEKYSSNEEYYTFVKKDNEYKINVNNYIYCENKNTRYVFDDIDVKIGKINRYSKYEEMTIEIKNNSQKTIAVTTNDAGNRVYLTNTKGAIYSSINSVLDEQDLILNAGETKEITVKFNKLYSVANKADKLIFPKIILDYEDYLSTHNRTAYSNTTTIAVQYN